MTVIEENIDAPGGTDPTNALITIKLKGVRPGVGYTDAPASIVGGLEITPDEDGEWTADLVPNADITPAGTVYQILLQLGGSGNPTRRYISVPDSGGPYTVEELLVDPPESPTPAALAVHAAQQGPNGHLPDGDPAEGDTILWDESEGVFVYAPAATAPEVTQAELDAEAAARAAGDVTLADAIVDEAATRLAADTDLDARTDALEAFDLTLSGTYDALGAAAAAEAAANAYTDDEVDEAVTDHIAALDPHGDRAYADGLIAAADAMVFRGVIDASGNPNYPAADAGHTYRISVAGKIGGAAGPNVEAGDILLALADGVAAGNHATVGGSWAVIQTNIDGAVIGPSAATDGAFALFDGVTGKLLKDGIVPSAFILTLLNDADADAARATLDAASPGDVAQAITDHVAATDPHGDRAAVAHHAFDITYGTRAFSNVNWATFSQASSNWFGGSRSTDTGAQNNEVVFVLGDVLRPGTWSFVLFQRQANNVGIATIAYSTDGSAWTDVGTVDGYAASAANLRSQIDGITIPAGVRYLRLKMASKNASSGAHVCNLNALSGARTGA